MNIDSAIKLLENTFKNSFNIENFQYFLTELFNTSNIHVKNQIKFVKKDFKDYVNQFYSLGSYEDKYGDTIGFYVVELVKESSRDRARTMQRNLIAHFMKKENKNAALVAFYEPGTEDWRFSHIKLSYEFGEKGLKEKLSSPRRHSFLVGPNEPNHTCQKQFLNPLISEEKPLLEEIEEAFNIENVTKDFFDEYKRLFLDLADSLREVKEKDNVVSEEFNNRNIKSSDFAKKLMGQLVFIYFLQKKGWLGVEEDADWGTGPKNFLRKIFTECIERGDNFFNDVLEHLFYEGLSEEVADCHYSKFNYKVPFLNGGLFEPINNYDWRNTEVTLENSIFSEILDTFDKFNFTVKEDEPLEKEVAVDPEMLGKVFENLLEVTDRKSKGAFYTPRHIVHYMCQENLIAYLNTNSGLSEKDLREFIINGDLAINSIIRAHEEKKKYKGRQYTRIELPNSIKENSDKLERLLKKVKVIDPAVGSGAFPVGMMNEIVKARYILRLLNDIEDVNMYDLKRETIENSLYGVDLELSATDVTKLRFWLSLIVDEEDIKHIKPLPNLDNQIMCGNSVIDGYNNIKLFDDSLIVRSEQTKLSMTPTERAFNQLESKKKEYFNTSGPLRKEELKNEIKELKWNFIETYLKDLGKSELIEEIRGFKYAESKPFFIWELEFSEIFKGENPGFDIVIGNPPYVRQEQIKDLQEYLEKHYKTFAGKADLFVYFFEKGLNLLKDNGIFAFICSNKFAKAKYGLNLRNLILNNELKIYDDFSGVKIFKEASVDTCVIQIKKSFPKNNEVFVNKSYHMPQNKLKPESFIFNSPDILNLRSKIYDSGTCIKDLDINISFGIKTGFNKAFIIDEETKNFLINKDQNNKNIIKPLIRGRDINKWKILFNDLYVILVKYGQGNNLKSEYPVIYEYLNSFESNLKKRGQVKVGQHHWLELDNNPSSEYLSSFQKEKISYAEIVPEPRFVYDNEGYCVDATGFIMSSETINMKYLLGLLNSNLLFWYFKDIGYNLGGKGFRYKKIFINELPIKLSEKEMETALVNLVDSILNLNKSFVNEVKCFNEILINEFNVNKLSNKLSSYYTLSLKDFLKEVKKQKVDTSNKVIEENITNKFNRSVNVINDLDAKIKMIEENINEMVYQIYGLNDKEKEIIKKEFDKI